MSSSSDAETKRLKGVNLSRTGYSFNTITLPGGSTAELAALLEEKIAPNREAYLNSPVVIDIARVADLEKLNYEELAQTCRKYGMFLLGLSGALTESQASYLYSRDIPLVNSNRYARVREQNFRPKVITQTFEVKVPIKIPVPYEVKVPEYHTPEEMLTIRRHVRSGESISARGSSVTVFGSVSSGARVIASHNVIIFGDLYGEIYAGSPKNTDDPGDPKSFIFVLGRFSPTFVAIAGNYQTADDMEQDAADSPLKGHRQSLLVSLDGKALKYSFARDLVKAGSKF